MVGIKHCGKTTVGKLLSNRFSVPFYDLDRLIEELYLQRSAENLTAREIYGKGSSLFREHETEASIRLSEKASGSRIVAAAGGGLCDNPGAVKALKGFLFVYISEKPEILYERISAGGLPAFLPSDNPREAFMELFNRRAGLYEELSGITVRAERRNPEQIAEETVSLLKEEGYAG